jgi:hypothetical protein
MDASAGASGSSRQLVRMRDRRPIRVLPGRVPDGLSIPKTGRNTKEAPHVGSACLIETGWARLNAEEAVTLADANGAGEHRCWS